MTDHAAPSHAGPSDAAPPRSAEAPGARTALEAVLAAYRAMDADGRPGVWIDLVDRGLARSRAAKIDARVAAGDDLPLAGTTLAVKGNIDVAGLDTTAACPAYARRADRCAPAVQALMDAGTVVIGTTNMDQFATGLVGTRSPYGLCPNAHWEGLVAGGSSSGSAVAVAAGMVDLALGTDTAGSGRVPAAANGIIGVKPTRGRISCIGVVPACASLDCVSVFARDVGLAARAVAIAGAVADPDDPWSRIPPSPPPDRTGVRVGIASVDDLTFDGDPGGVARHAAASAVVTAALGPDAEVVGLPAAELEHLVATGRLLYDGAFVAERYIPVGEFIDTHPGEVDPVVGSIITAAGRIPAWRLAADLEALATARRRTAGMFERLDVLVLPTVPRLPTVEEVLAEPIAVNAMLGTYTTFVNLLDLCAVTVPVDVPGDGPGRPPHSVSLIAPAWSDDLLVNLATSIAGAPANPPTR